MSQTSGKIPSKKREARVRGALREPDKCEAVPPSEAAEGTPSAVEARAGAGDGDQRAEGAGTHLTLSCGTLQR